MIFIIFQLVFRYLIKAENKIQLKNNLLDVG
jgi:hypothetical protein